MKGQRMAVYAGLLATAVVTAVAGLVAREAQTSGDARRADRERQVERQIYVAPGDRRVIQLDGGGSQLGVMVSDLDRSQEAGVRIDDVDEGSAAAKGGVKAGDIVVEFDGERVRSARQFSRLVQETPAGRAVKLTVRRGGARQTLDVTPEARDVPSWTGRGGRDLEREIERGVEQGLRDLPRRMEPYFDFDFDFDGLTVRGSGGRLGVQVVRLSDQLATYFGATGGGVLVSGVTPDSAAAKAGMKAGDVITKVNGEAVKDPGDLVAALRDVKDDGAVALDIVRDRKATSLKATIEPRRPSRPARTARPA